MLLGNICLSHSDTMPTGNEQNINLKRALEPTKFKFQVRIIWVNILWQLGRLRILMFMKHWTHWNLSHSSNVIFLMSPREISYFPQWVIEQYWSSSSLQEFLSLFSDFLQKNFEYKVFKIGTKTHEELLVLPGDC